VGMNDKPSNKSQVTGRRAQTLSDLAFIHIKLVDAHGIHSLPERNR
jgi:hypothetical protein